MKKIIFLMVLSIFVGCKNLPSATSNKTSPFIQNKISTYVDLKTETYGLGVKKITSAGNFIAEGKAKKESILDLRKKIALEVDKYFETFLKSVDPYSKSMFLNSKSELETYAIDAILLKASQKESFSENGKIYIISLVKKEDIFKESKFTFVEYSSNVIKRLEKIKNSVESVNFQIQTYASKENFFREKEIKKSPRPIEEKKEVFSETNFTSLEDDPLFL